MSLRDSRAELGGSNQYQGILNQATANSTTLPSRMEGYEVLAHENEMREYS